MSQSPPQPQQPVPVRQPHPVVRAFQWLLLRTPRMWRFTRPFLVVAALAHLALFLVFPGGVNRLFDLRPKGGLQYLTHFNAPDGFGFWSEPVSESYVRYRIFTQEGTVHEGVLPDLQTEPMMRYERWSRAANAVALGGPQLQANLGRHIATSMPSIPFRVQLYTSHWIWDGKPLALPPGWPWDNSKVEEQLMGNQLGLTGEWKPGATGGGR